MVANGIQTLPNKTVTAGGDYRIVSTEASLEIRISSYRQSIGDEQRSENAVFAGLGSRGPGQ